MRYDFLPCLACGSLDHYLDNCPDGEAVARYYADNSEGSVQRWDEQGQDPGQ